jgi:hypothetical protein
VAELTGYVELAGWPEGTRLIACRERPHPAAKLSFTDHDDHRFTCFVTDQADEHLAALELAHRRRTGLRIASAAPRTRGSATSPSTPSPTTRSDSSWC